MSRHLFLSLGWILLGATASIGSRAMAAAPAPAPGDECGVCASGIGIWNQVINVVDSNGNPCSIIAIWWRKDGTCHETADGDCVETDACKYICQTQSNCANANSEFSVQVSSPGGLNFSTFAAGAKVVGAPYCGWATQFTMCAVNLITGEATCVNNWAGCGDCGGGPVEPPDGGGGGGGGGGDDGDGGGD